MIRYGIVLALCLISIDQAFGTPPRFPPWKSALTVTSVPKGDLLTAHGERRELAVCLRGIECPSTQSALGKQAQEYVSGLIRNNKVALDLGGVEPYNQSTISADVILEDGSSLTLLLLERGFAQCKEDITPAKAIMLKAQHEAQQKKVGLWAAAATGTHAAFTSTPWRDHVVRQFNGHDKPIAIPSKLHIVTESWNRVTAVPYIVYMPEKKRLLMLIGCDYPHHAMVLTSDDRGATWTAPRPAGVDKDGKILPGLGVGLSYLGGGKLCFVTDRLWFSSDYGETWGGLDAQTAPMPIPPAPDGKTWNLWDPMFVERTAAGALRLVQTGYTMDTARYESGGGPGYSTGYLRFSTDMTRTWSDTVAPAQWKGVSEVCLVRAKNRNLVAACRTDIPAHFKGQTLDHYEGLAVSISKDDGRSWSDLNRLYEWGRHHPNMFVTPSGDIVMTYVVRKGYVDTAEGMIQFGIEAIVSHDNGATWDLDHRYVLHSWPGNRKGPESWWASSQATSSVQFFDGTILTAFGTGYRSQPGPAGPSPRDVGLVQWRLNDAAVNDDHALRDAPFDSEKRNILNPNP